MRDSRGPADREVVIESVRPHGGRLLVRLAGISDRDAADALRGGLFVDLHAVTRQGLLASVERYGLKELEPEHREVEVPVTHLKLFGWYDNEFGSYTRRLSNLCHYIADRLG